jgi:hypothetical protein
VTDNNASATAPDDLQFDVAEPVQPAPTAALTGPSCAACKQPMTGVYWGIKGQAICTPCKEAIQQKVGDTGQPPTAKQLFMAVGLGLGAAIVGAIGWGVITAASGYNIGLVAILVGWIIGASIRRASNGRGGLLFQLIAIAMVWLSIGGSEIFGELFERGSQDDATEILSNPILCVLMLVATPVFQALSGHIISILINGFALWQAWKMTRRIKIPFTGPHAITPRPAGGPPPLPLSAPPLPQVGG